MMLLLKLKLKRLVPALLLLLPLAGAPLHAQRFLPDDPLRIDHDDLPIARPREIELSTAFDVMEQTFSHRPHGPIPPAVNVNTLGEVPDSSWFTDRAGTRDLSIEEVVHGPNHGEGPDTRGPWTILSGKSQGITPGFTIRDSRSQVYFVKFDRSEYPHLSTAAEVISTRLFHAFGYSVPENHLTYFRREQLVIADGARIPVKGGPRRKMTEADLDRLLRNVARRPDGTLRAVASLRLAGAARGPAARCGPRRGSAAARRRQDGRHPARRCVRRWPAATSEAKRSPGRGRSRFQRCWSASRPRKAEASSLRGPALRPRVTTP